MQNKVFFKLTSSFRFQNISTLCLKFINSIYHADQFEFYKKGDRTSPSHESIPYKPNHKLIATEPFLNPEIIPTKSIDLSTFPSPFKFIFK